MKNQTAVEWLVSQLNKNGFAQVVTDEEIEQAKAMETEQIIDAFYDGCFDTNSWRAEQYYKETYEK